MKGYACRADGKMLIETVGPTIRVAMVNGLILKGHITLNIATDMAIRRHWLDNCERLGLEMVRVTITSRGPVDVREGPIA